MIWFVNKMYEIDLEKCIDFYKIKLCVCVKLMKINVFWESIIWYILYELIMFENNLKRIF